MTNKRQRIPKGQSNNDNPEKLATQGTQDTGKTKQRHNTICVGHHYTETKRNSVNKTCVLLQTTGGTVCEHRFYAEIVILCFQKFQQE